MTIRELRQKRAQLIAQARQVLDAADAEGRSLTQEEENQWNAIMDDVASLGADIERRERQEALERDLQQPAGEPVRPDPENRGGGDPETTDLEFVSRGMREIEPEELRPLMRFAEPSYGRAFATWLRDGASGLATQELRALQADSDILGGYLYAPLQFIDRLIKAVDDLVYIRQWATVIPVTNGESLGVPTLDSDPADADWTSELATGTEDTSMAFGRRELNPHPLAKRIKISRKLLRKAPGAEQLVRARLAYKFGITFEKACLAGSGAQEPLGIFTVSGDGISTSRDVSEGNTTTGIQFDGLISAKYALKVPYWSRARWIFHRDGVKQIAKLKDDNGQYLWRESVRVGEPDRVLGFPVFMSEFTPNTFTAGQYVGALADFSWYWIADSLAMEVQRLDELYAETNQVGLIGRLESDGMPVLEEAFVRVQLAQS